MVKVFAICAALMLVSAAAYAALPTTTQVISYDFSGRTAGTAWADGIYWGDGTGTVSTVYDDGGAQGMCGKFNVITSGSGWHEVFFNQGLADDMMNYDINVLSFKVKYLGGLWDRWDRAVVVDWGNDSGDSGGIRTPGEFAYGSAKGTGFNFATESSAGKAMGALGYGAESTSNPGWDHGWTTGSTTPGLNAGKTNVASDWITMAMSVNRTNGMIEWYANGTMFASQQVLESDPTYGQWVWGQNSGDAARWMQWFSVGQQAKYVGATGSILFDDFYLGGANVPEPSSLMAFGAFGLGALGFIRRRRA